MAIIKSKIHVLKKKIFFFFLFFSDDDEMLGRSTTSSGVSQYASDENRFWKMVTKTLMLDIVGNTGRKSWKVCWCVASLSHRFN